MLSFRFIDVLSLYQIDDERHWKVICRNGKELKEISENKGRLIMKRDFSEHFSS